MSRAIQIGLEVFCEAPEAYAVGQRLGLLMNSASVDSDLRYACDLVAEKLPGRLTCLFSPQHGLWGEQQANMIETPHGEYEELGIPVFSLYSETRRPSREMLAECDCLLIDLQDVGTRVYTFAWTVFHCLEACAELSIPVILLDRPNPLGGTIVEGPDLEAAYRSFVGKSTIPMRHALSLGELARLLNREESLKADLTVVPMRGWERSLLWNDLDRPWLAPSPNLPRFESTLLYPGQVLLEGTNLSEGRGTTAPFEVVGAPFLSSRQLMQASEVKDEPGITFMPTRFLPTFDKWCNQSCQGVALRVREPSQVRSFELTVKLLGKIARDWPDHFQFLPPPYEYETQRMPIDILYGSSALREAIDSSAHTDAAELCRTSDDPWWDRVEADLLY